MLYLARTHLGTTSQCKYDLIRKLTGHKYYVYTWCMPYKPLFPSENFKEGQSEARVTSISKL